MQVTLEFPVDDTAGGDNEDALTDMVFYVPKEASGFADNGEEQAAKVPAKSSWEPSLDPKLVIIASVGTFDSSE